MIAYVRQNSIANTSSCPTGSGRRACAARDSGTNSAVSTIASRPIGTFTRNTQRQPGPSTSAPPSSGPSAMLMPTTPAHSPIA
jgi:hypothetical protein